MSDIPSNLRTTLERVLAKLKEADEERYRRFRAELRLATRAGVEALARRDETRARWLKQLTRSWVELNPRGTIHDLANFLRGQYARARASIPGSNTNTRKRGC